MGLFIFFDQVPYVMYLCFLSRPFGFLISLRDLFSILSDSMSTEIIVCDSELSFKSQTALDLGKSLSPLLQS
jgi:hypothetical protein